MHKARWSEDSDKFIQQYIKGKRSIYRKTSSISRTKSENWNVSCILLQLSSLNPLEPGVKLRMKM